MLNVVEQDCLRVFPADLDMGVLFKSMLRKTSKSMFNSVLAFWFSINEAVYIRFCM